MSKSLFIFDTNTFISAQLIGHSTSAKAFDKALLTGILALSHSVFAEYTEVLYRKKLDRYLSDERRKSILDQLKINSLFFQPLISVQACRDQKDNHILELAICCQAHCIVSGDQDLLVLNPFENIPILTGADFLIQA
nr:putative toxin-antitoxin system toxin component, PIN family [uncultured bacterium]